MNNRTPSRNQEESEGCPGLPRGKDNVQTDWERCGDSPRLSATIEQHEEEEREEEIRVREIEREAKLKTGEKDLDEDPVCHPMPSVDVRRDSRGSILGKGANVSCGPPRSISFTSPRDRTKMVEIKNAEPKSPTASTKRPMSPQLSPNQNVNPGTPLNKRSIGPPDSKLVVLGSPCVGKSAIVVRLLTGRFIWEYDPTLEAIYRYHTTIDDDPAFIEILDTAGSVEGKLNEGHVRWADGFLIVYSLTDRSSFLAVPDIHSSIASVKHTPNFPCVIIANKSDLVHSRVVDNEEASSQASDLGVSFFSASACEGSPSLLEAFSELHRDVVRRFRSRRRRSSAKVVIEGFYKMFTR